MAATAVEPGDVGCRGAVLVRHKVAEQRGSLGSPLLAWDTALIALIAFGVVRLPQSDFAEFAPYKPLLRMQPVTSHGAASALPPAVTREQLIEGSYSTSKKILCSLEYLILRFGRALPILAASSAKQVLRITQSCKSQKAYAKKWLSSASPEMRTR